MTRRWILRLASLACVGFAVWWWRQRGTAKTQSATGPDAPAAAPPRSSPPPVWVAPVDGACPDGYPVKLNESSGIFHVPGGRFYQRTIPERCYATAAGAAADGYRQAKA